MAVSTAIYTILRLNANVLSRFEDRIYPVVADQNTALPCIVYTVTGSSQSQVRTAVNKQDRIQVRVSVYANTLTRCEEYVTDVYTALNEYKGTQSSEVIQNISFEGYSWDAMEVVAAGAQTGQMIYIVNMDFTIYRG